MSTQNHLSKLDGSLFPNPYYDIASTYIPSDIKKAFKWCEYLYLAGNGIVKAATDRIVQYFVTDIQYKNNTKNTENLKEILEKHMIIKSRLIEAGRDLLIYGNSISSIYLPFIRMLVCPKCGTEQNSRVMKSYSYSQGQFSGTCDVCRLKSKYGYSEFEVNYEARERNDANAEKIKLIRLDPGTFDIKRHPLAGVEEHYWKLPRKLIKSIKEDKDKFYIDYTKQDVLDAVEKEESFKWNEKFIYHMKMSTIAGFPLEWGMPMFLGVIKQSFYSAVLRRANEAIAQDFIIPFRVLSPGPNSPNFDPVSQSNLEDFSGAMRHMVGLHRQDPTLVQIAPMPIMYQAFGAEKKALDVSEDIKGVNEEILHSLNYPAELFFNTLKIQAVPSALRMFENTWTDLVAGINNYLQWTADHICDFMRWEREEVSMARVTVADDMEKRQMLMQLASAQQVSWMSALKSYGIDYEKEQKKLMEEAKMIMENNQKMQDEMAMENEMGLGQGEKQAPTDINTAANQKAQEWLNMAEPDRVRDMKATETFNETLYSMAKNKMEKIRNTSRTQQGYENLAAAGMTGHMQQ